MKLMNWIIIVLTTLLSSCATQYNLTVINSYPQNIEAIFDSAGDKDSVKINGDSQLDVASIAMRSSNKPDDLELKTIVIRSADNKLLHTYRFSISYLESKKWMIKIPFTMDDTIPPKSLNQKDYFELGRGTTLFHIAQEYYNSGQYEKCCYILAGYFYAGGSAWNNFRLRHITSKNDLYMERGKLVGYAMLSYLSLKKMNRCNELDDLFDTIKKTAPDYSKYLQKYDPDFGK